MAETLEQRLRVMRIECIRDEVMEAGSYLDQILTEAVDALAAMSCPDGWKMVPVEPTYDMAIAGNEHTSCGGSCGNKTALDCWRAMLSAAPLPTNRETLSGNLEPAEKLGVLDCRDVSSAAPIESGMSLERAP